MNQPTQKSSRRVFTIANQGLRKSFWIGLGIVFSLAIALSTSGQSQYVLAPHRPQNAAFQLHHVTLSVSNAEQVSKWYADVLGFKIRDRLTLTRPTGGKIQVVRVAIPGLQMNISQFDGSISPNRNGERQGWRHLALQVDNVDLSYQQLQAKGVQFLGKPFTYNPPGYRVAFLRDPEGNILELYQGL
jgi:catechol 2,3-dioxygenase-like lactoylglutathione lyase family enzyme